MTKEIKNWPASVHTRLLRIAKDEGKAFQEVFYLYAWERFLYRLHKSEYANSFVLKGALMFFGWGLPLRRSTRDIDLQGYTSNSIDELVHVVRQICVQPVEQDGMVYDPESVAGEEIINNALYHGVRLRFKGFLGNAEISMQVDVSFANVITPSVITFNYPILLSNLGMSPFTLIGYPYETTIAKKFQIMVKFEIVHDRIRDFYDIWLIAHQFNIHGQILADAIFATFHARDTLVPSEIPITLTEIFVHEKETQWKNFHNNLPDNSWIPNDFNQIIADLHNFLVPPMLAAYNSDTFELVWVPGQGWRKK
jgi:hypothetical protein